MVGVSGSDHEDFPLFQCIPWGEDDVVLENFKKSIREGRPFIPSMAFYDEPEVFVLHDSESLEN